MTKKLSLLCISVVFIVSPRAASASRFGKPQMAAILVAPIIHTDAQRIAELEKSVAEAKGLADNSWMLMSSALVCALYLGKRIGYPAQSVPPHSVVLSFIGACLLWVGWFGFNAGSALSSGTLATSAFVATHSAAASAAAGWSLAEWKRNGRPSALGAISGAVAGLVAITPASGFVKPMPALIIGFVAGILCYFMVAKVKARFGYDDSLDAFGVHGAGGTIGAILTGVFAVSSVNPILKDSRGNVLALGLIEGNAHQLLNQMAGVAIAWGLGIAGTIAILFFVDKLVGLRASPEHEIQGLDLSQHGEEAYNWEAS
jgi:ammonium transporter, Amt family